MSQITNNAELQAALWALYNEGKMPVEIRAKYGWHFEMCNDKAYFDLVELTDDGSVYQGLPIVFDHWCKTPFIKTVPRTE